MTPPPVSAALSSLSLSIIHIHLQLIPQLLLIAPLVNSKTWKVQEMLRYDRGSKHSWRWREITSLPLGLLLLVWEISRQCLTRKCVVQARGKRARCACNISSCIQVRIFAAHSNHFAWKNTINVSKKPFSWSKQKLSRYLFSPLVMFRHGLQKLQVPGNFTSVHTFWSQSVPRTNSVFKMPLFRTFLSSSDVEGLQ